jgi:hypothetical protein
MMRQKCLQLLFVFCISVPALSGATITSGFIQVSPGIVYPTGTFTLSGDGFDVSGLIDGGRWPVFSWCYGLPGHCDPGASVGVGGSARSFDIVGGYPATVDGITYPSLGWGDSPSWSSFLAITGDPITLDAGPGLYTSAFSFEGGLCGKLPGDPSVGPCVVDLRSLSGIGTVAMTFAEGPAFPHPHTGPSLRVTGVTYTFIPEPSTLVLTAAGLALVIAAARRRKLRRFK